MSVTVVPEAHVARLMDGFLTTQLLYVAAQLGIADALTEGPRSATELAQVVGARTGPLARVLRGLAIEGVIEERQDGRFALTTAGARLAELHGPLLARGEVYYRAAGGLLDAADGCCWSRRSPPSGRSTARRRSGASNCAGAVTICCRRSPWDERPAAVPGHPGHEQRPARPFAAEPWGVDHA